MHLRQTLGFTLLEVIISMMILSLVLLGLDVMEIKALGDNRASYFFNVASNQLQVMADILFEIGENAGLSQQVLLWNHQNILVLPEGNGVVSGVYPNYKIAITWGIYHQCEKIQLGKVGCLTEEVNL